ELKRLGRPMIVARNMSDLATQRGYTLDRVALERALGVAVMPTVVVRSGGERALAEDIDAYGCAAETAARTQERIAPPPLGSAAGTAARPVARWRGRRDRQCAGVPAADSHPVPVHPRPGGFRLSAACRVHAGSAHVTRGPLGPRIHSSAVELCVRHSRHHGGAH